MRLRTILTNLVVPVHHIYALPAPESSQAVVPYAIKDVCTNLALLDQGTEYYNNQATAAWIVADCLISPDSSERRQSAVFLGDKIGVDGPNLKFKVDGNYWLTAYRCQLTGASTLTCSCEVTGPYDRKECSIDLDRGISVYDGYMLSNLNGTPTPPKSPSKYPVPRTNRDVLYFYGGIASCPIKGDGDPCRYDFNRCLSSDNRNDRGEYGRDRDFEASTPLSCYKTPSQDNTFEYFFDTLKVSSGSDWEILVYGDERCSDKPVAVIGPNDLGKCVKLARQGKAFSTRPLFDAD